jgi:CHAT domain
MRTATIRIGERVGDGYPLTLEADDGEPAVQATLPADLDVDGIRRALLEAAGPTPALADVGSSLHEHICAGDVGTRWKALARNPLRTLLDIADRDLRRLPWELMFDKHSRIATREDRPLARTAPGYPADAGEAIAWPLRILVVVGIAQTDSGAKAEEEIDELPDAFRRICGLVDIECKYLPSRKDVADACKAMRPHVLHVIAHGDKDDGGNGCLLIEDAAAGEAWQWTATDIPEDLLAPRPRLVVLNACRSAEVEEQEATWGVTDAFLELGVAAVIGMQGDISGLAAAGFSAGLYGALAEGLPVDVALARARKLVIDRTSAQHRDWALPALVTAVAPEDILSTTPPLPAAVRNQLQQQIGGFIDRSEPRREVWSKLSLGRDPDAPELDALAVVGPAKIGKSELVKWCVNASALNGRNVAYVDLKSQSRLPFLRVLGLIAEAFADSPIHGDRNAAAFDRWLERVDELLGPSAQPEEPEGDYHRVFPTDPPETADEAVFTTFADALRAAADKEALVFALDHASDRNVLDVHWTQFLVRRLLKDIVLHRLDPVRVILVGSDDFLAALTGSTTDIHKISLASLPGTRFRELMRIFLLYNNFDRQGVDTFLSGLPDASDWEPQRLAEMANMAGMFNVAKVAP